MISNPLLKACRSILVNFDTTVRKISQDSNWNLFGLLWFSLPNEIIQWFFLMQSGRQYQKKLNWRWRESNAYHFRAKTSLSGCSNIQQSNAKLKTFCEWYFCWSWTWPQLNKRFSHYVNQLWDPYVTYCSVNQSPNLSDLNVYFSTVNHSTICIFPIPYMLLNSRRTILLTMKFSQTYIF